MKRVIYKNENGISPVIETLVAVGISVVLLAVFFTSATNLFTVYETPNVDLQAKSIGIMGTLLNSPGQDAAFNPNWESDYQNVSVVGLGTSPTITYGVVHINDQGESTVISQYNFSNSSSGIATTCFLEGTKIVMADHSYKNVEDIKVGDMVKSYDEETGEIVDRAVTHVFHHTPKEMTDYYLVINNFLRVTPNHLIYSDGGWGYADDLKTGDSLFYPRSDYKIYSIEKVFKEEPTYDFEVEGIHNYFVALDTSDVLVHNAGPTEPIARFTWFDSDGPYRSETKITFNAEDSKSFTGGIISYWWDFDEDGECDDGEGKHISEDWGGGARDVTLKVVDGGGPNTVTHTVQANTVNPPDVDERPWILTGKDVYPDQTFVPYGKDHYIEYTSLEESYYLFEIKEKTASTNNILDFEKIENLSNVYYSVVKSALGIESESAICEFSITIVTTVNEIDVVTYTYGASSGDAYALESTTREILVYHKPETTGCDISKGPYYETGRITVCVFLGSLGPNYPPYIPSDPSPADGAIGVARNADLSWTGGDPNPRDTVTYDVYFGTTNPPPKIEPGNQSTTTYDPGIMEPTTTYYWQIVAWDNHDASTEGPVWSFTTGPNNLPNTPSNPDPENGANHVSVTTMLSWTCSDPDGDPLSYNVYFSTVNWSGGLPPVPKETDNNFYDTSSDGGRLEYDTKYYWMIGAKDDYGITFGPIWNFTTAEKGLDQYNTEGSDEGLSTREFYLGQTFTAGRTGNLTNIKLSLKYEGPPNIEDITVNLYRCESGDPNDLGELLATTIIESFDDTSFVWKNAIFDTPADVTEGYMYFIEIPQTGKIYSWQYSIPSVEPQQQGGGGGGSYLGGMPYISLDEGMTWTKADEIEDGDFLFKTYVFREPEIDQSCLEQTGNGIATQFDLAQTFTAGRRGDLMKVDLSFAYRGLSSVITVEIYSDTPEEWKETGMLPPIATTTIDGFDESFVWKEAVFGNVPVLKEGGRYSIVIPSVQLYEWEMSEGDAYGEGAAWQKNGEEWMPLEGIDFIFVTYMDEFG